MAIKNLRPHNVEGLEDLEKAVHTQKPTNLDQLEKYILEECAKFQLKESGDFYIKLS